jgi:hypothetical protein
MSRTIMDPATAANRLIKQLLGTLVAHAPRVAAASLSVLGADDSQCGETCRDDHVAKVVGRFRSPARPSTPVPDWEALVPAFRAGHCPVLRADASSTLFCPAVNPQGDLVGAVLIVIEGGRHRLRGTEQARLMSAGVRVAGQIAAVLDVAAQTTEPLASLTAAQAGQRFRSFRQAVLRA